MQNDWAKWLFIAEFADNNAISASIDMNLFFVNKDFNPRMFFSPNNIEYITARERLGSIKAEDISEIMQRVLEYMQQQFHKAREIMIRQVNKNRKEVSYEIKDKVFLFNRNITTDRPFKKLEDKMLSPFLITERVETSYRLQLSKFMRVHDVFHLNLLRKDFNDSLFEQIQKPSGLIITKEDEEYELNDIKNSRWYYGRLQYRCKWINQKQKNMTWYNADGDEFKNAKKIIDDFHNRYSMTAESSDNAKPSTRRFGRKASSSRQSSIWVEKGSEEIKISTYSDANVARWRREVMLRSCNQLNQSRELYLIGASVFTVLFIYWMLLLLYLLFMLLVLINLHPYDLLYAGL